MKNYDVEQKKKKKNSNLIWVIIGAIALVGISSITYLLLSKKNSDNSDNPTPNIEYLPSELESTQKIQNIAQQKGLDQTQATIEFLTGYVPEIKWWEINSLSELNKKIELVNSKTGFCPFSTIPNDTKFNKEWSGSLLKKSLLFVASIIPRQSDNSVDWQGYQDWASYFANALQPLLENRKFKPSFATHSNYRALGREIVSEINPQLSKICLDFASLSSLNEFNQLTNNYLSETTRAEIYDTIHDSLGEQLKTELGITNHKKYERKNTGSSVANYQVGLALNEFNLQGGSTGELPQPPDPGEKWEVKRSRLTKEAEDEINRKMTVHKFMYKVLNEELQITDWYVKLLKTNNETEFNLLKQAILKDVAELNIAFPDERSKLKDYFIFCPWPEINSTDWIDGNWNVRKMEDILAASLNQAIKSNPKSTWQRKFMAFTGGFNINSVDKAKQLDNWIKNSQFNPVWIVIRKDHNPNQYQTERNTFFLKKGLPDYHEFNSRKEAINFLRQNDSYFSQN